MIKNLKHSLLAVALVIGFSMTASAQKEDDKKPPPPPKGRPPVIVVNPDKKPKEDKPKGEKKPEARIIWKRDDVSYALPLQP